MLRIARMLVGLLFPLLLAGQSFTASVRGLVTDPTGAAVPGAKVILKDVDRNVQYKTESDAMGRYSLTALPVGTYMLTAECPGFQTYQRSAFRLEVQQQATVDVQLQVGAVSTSVQVEAGAPLLNTTSANLGQVIENQYIDRLPLIARNVYQLVYLAPGIVGSAGSQVASGASNFSAVGTRNSTAEIMLDGVTVTAPEQNGGISAVYHTPSVDAVQEFKVQTAFFSAEFGNAGGAVINMVTKTGTNALHGSAYWFRRDSAISANSFFSNRAGTRKPSSHRNLYGGTAGGPIKRDKAFFFFAYERTPQKSPYAQTATFPTPQQHQGNFTDYVTSTGLPIAIYNPFDTYTNAAGEIKRRPFPGNVIPKSMFDPVATKAASYYPAPTRPGIINNWYAEGVTTSTDWQIEAKADYNVTEKDRLSARYSPRRSLAVRPNLFGEGKPGLPWEIKHMRSSADNGMLDFTRTHSPQTVFNVRLGVLRPENYHRPLVPFDLTTLGLPQYMKDASDYPVFPQFQPEGYTAIGDAGYTYIGNRNGSRQLLPSVTHFASAHSLKAGMEYRRNYLDYNQSAFPSGSFSFSRQITREDRFTATDIQGNGFASMLLGWGSGSRFDHRPWTFNRNEYYAGYFQDDWKLTRRWTLNLGLRYEVERPHWEIYYRESYWNLDDPSPLQGKVPGFDLRGFFMFCNERTPSPYNGDHKNWQPRVGFAFALDDRTSVRAGYGTFFTLSRASTKGTLGAGFTSISSVTWSLDSNATRYATLSNPYPDGLNLPPGNSLGPMTFIGLDAGTIVRENVKPRYDMWNFSIQRQLSGASLVEVTYIGNKGTHQYLPDAILSRLAPRYWSLGRNELNRMVPNPFYGVITDARSVLSRPTTQLYRLLKAFPQYASASRSGSEPTRGDSNYHSVQFRFERRLAGGLAMLAHYTISKMLDDCANGSTNWDWLGGSAYTLQDFYNFRNERALAIHDIPQRLVVTFSYRLPVGAGKLVGSQWSRPVNAVLGGWEVSGYVTLQSGAPLTVTQSGGTLWDATQRPDLVGNPDPGTSMSARLYRYFNEAAFRRPAADTLGTAPRNLNYRAPGTRAANVAMHKAFEVHERMKLEVRVELENVTNTPCFGFPNTSFGSTAFGTITGYRDGTGPRQGQFAAKLHF